MKRARWLLVPALLLLGLTGALLSVKGWCSSHQFVDSDQPHREGTLAAELAPGQPVGQTFLARHGGLSGFEIFLVPESGLPATLTLHLRTDPAATTDLSTASLRLPIDAESGFYRFSFPGVENSHAEYYYAVVEAAEPGISVALAEGARYLDGAAYQAHKPLDAQTAFRLAYEPGFMILDLLRAMIRWIGLLAVSGLLFVVPGWALLAWLLPERRLTWAELLGLAVGVSLALYALLLLWTDLVGLHLGALYAWLPVVFGLAALVWRYRTWRPSQGRDALQRWARSGALWPDLTFMVVLGLAFWVRLLVVRTAEAPLWGDSVQHATIAQLLLDNGGLFDSWDPYAPYRSLTVHFGFPTAVALESWVTRTDSVQGTLLVGQLINGMAALTLYPLAVRFAKGNGWAGTGAALVVGLLSPMPAEYVNWGRYAQLAGQVILPVALWLLWEVVQSDTPPWKAACLAGSTAAGMGLAYYRMPFYYATFVLAWLLGWGLPHWRLNIRLWFRGLIRLVLVAGVTLLLLLPVGLRLAGGHLAAGLGASVTTVSPLDAVLADYRVWRNISRYVPPPLLIAALIALIWSMLRRRWVVASIGLWVLALSSLVAGQLIRLPGANYMQNFAILIALYIPAGLLIGWLIGQVAELAGRWTKQWTMALALLAVAAWGFVGQAKVVQARFVMVTHPDTQAMAWIEQSTPPESLFLVEGYRIYGGLSAVGADAGWWIPLLAHRHNTMPPQYALLSEAPVQPGYSQDVVDLVTRLETTSPASAEGIQALCEWGVTHVYVGQGHGEVGIGAIQLFSPGELAGNPAFDQIYHRDRVSVFALDPTACGEDE